MSDRFWLQTLGVPRLFVAEGRELRVRTRKHLGLLVYLAVEPGHAARREFLIDLLWPKSTLSHGRQSLSTAVSALRVRLGRDTIESDRGRVRLRRERFQLDLERLEAGDILGRGDTPPLEVAGFLAGYEMEDAPEFQLWRDRQQARLLPAIERALVILADHARRTADLTQLGRQADRLLALNELSEAGIRARMEAHALGGDRITALRIYDDWEKRLAAEIGAKPSALLEGMALRLRLRGLERPLTSSPPPVRTEHWRERPFIGRAADYRVLYELWESLPTAGARHCLIEGDSGVGKTTIADRLGTAVALEGAHVARVRCYDLERGIPYMTLGGLVEVLLDRPGSAATDRQSLGEIGRIVPAVRQRFANLPEPGEVQGEAARIRLAEAVLDLLTALMEEHPVLMIVDDFSLSDDASLSVLHLLMRRLADKPLMVVLTSRRESLEGRPNAQRIWNGTGYLGMKVLRLEPMPRREMEVLLDSLVREGHPRPGPSERRVLLRAAAGYPLALELLFRDWIARGAKSMALSLDAMTAEVAEQPEKLYQALADEMIRTMDSTTRMALSLASVLDRRLNELEMYALVDQTPAQAMVCLARLVELRAMRDRGTGLEFINPGMRLQAYMGLPPSVRRTLHDGVATRLLAREEAGERVRGLEVAWHCIRSGRREQSGPYLVRGAREAIDDGAPHEAELALASGIVLLNGDLQQHAYILWAEALQELGRWQDSVPHLEIVKGSSRRELSLRASLLATLARIRAEQIATDGLTRIITDLNHIVSTDEDHSLRVLAAAVSATACEQSRDPGNSLATRRASSAIPSHGLSPVDSLRLAVARAMLAYQERDIDAAEEELRNAAALSDQHSIRNSLLLQVLIGLGVVAVAKGDYGSATHYFLREYSLARKLDDELSVKRAAANLALCHARLGNLEEQHRWATLCVSVEAVGNDSAYQVTGLGILGLAQAIKGERDHARRTAGELVDGVECFPHPWLRQMAAYYAADILWILDEKERSLVLVRTALRGEYDRPRSKSAAGAFARWVAVCTRAGKHPYSPSREQIECIRKLIRERQRLDAKDAAEVLAAMKLLEGLPPEQNNELGERLGALPPGLLDLFFRLGLEPGRLLATSHNHQGS
jgi:DNA-binding SARP family transcriptional activator